MSENPTVAAETCPNCGAPLELDSQGRCRWCKATIKLFPSGSPSSAGAVPATFHVAAVTRPSVWFTGEVILVTGVLRGEFESRLRQVVASVQPAAWPAVGQDLPAVFDPANPTRGLEVKWSAGADNGAAQGWWQDGPIRDAGPNGSHLRAAAEYLASCGIQPDDFDLMHDWPDLGVALARACSRYCTVIPHGEQVPIMYTGKRAQGTVIGVQPLLMPSLMPDLRLRFFAWVTFDVKPAHGRSYRTTVRLQASTEEGFANNLKPGVARPLRIDKTDRAKVMPDMPAMGVTPSRLQP